MTKPWMHSKKNGVLKMTQKTRHYFLRTSVTEHFKWIGNSKLPAIASIVEAASLETIRNDTTRNIEIRARLLTNEELNDILNGPN